MSVFLGRVCCLLLLSVYVSARGTAPGLWKGTVQVSNSGREFWAFTGIRYALPPMGSLRFREPHPLEDHSQELTDATREGSVCLQFDPLSDTPEEVIGEEDCLFLNIYTPGTSNGSYPVIFWIHGGGWKYGSGSAQTFGPQALLDQDVVLVTINYRLGVIGFSSLEDEVFPGNLGLKDMVAALDWVHRNIATFGGDPDRITAAGQSAGAAAVFYLLNAPVTRGMLAGGIAQSGSWLSPWALGRSGSVRDKTVKVAKAAGCSGVSSLSVMNCLTEIPPKQLLEATKTFGLLEQQLIPWRPVVEPQGGIVTADPWSQVPRPLPLLTGFTSAEGAFFAALISEGGGFLVTVLDNAFSRFAPEMLMYADTASTPDLITTAVRRFYLGKSNISLDNLAPVIDMVSDAWINHPVHESALRHTGAVYGYFFDYSGTTDVVHVMGSTRDLGVSHGDDVPYLFQTEKLNIQKVGSENDREKSKEMVEIWANFAATGIPSLGDLVWSPLREGGYMSIANDGYSQGAVLETRLNFWESLPYRDKIKS